MSPSDSFAPGWYGDPYIAGTLRYHDGATWTQHVAQAPRIQPVYPPAAPIGASPSDPIHWLLPIGRTWQSITAGYVALFAIVIWPLGPVALGLGLWAVNVSGHTGTHGRGRSVFAIIVGALATAAMIGVLLT